MNATTVSPLRQRMIEDMSLRNLGPRTQEAYIRGCKKLAAFLRRSPETATAEELSAYCRGQIATVKIPRYWKFVEAFPMTVTGKIQKFLMREQAVQELGLQDAAATRTA